MTKRLVIFCDGTWKSEDDQEPSNVERLWDLVGPRGSDGVEQQRFYQPGVGTNPTRGAVNRKLSQWGGGGLGLGLDRNILEVYRWLTHEYEPGDELWFFGFSRGAYTVRSAVGLLRNCGIVRPQHAGLADKAMDLYRARAPDSHPNAPRSRSFRANYAHEVQAVRFLGVWDTVGALGIPGWLGLPARLVNRRYRFHDAQLSSIVQHSHQALAVDERRRSFAPALWKEEKGPFPGTMEQVWFAGVHSDIGGGYTERGLSDLTLHWMLERAVPLGLGIDEGRAARIEPDWRGVLHDSRWLPHRLPLVSQLATRRRRIAVGHQQGIHASADRRMRELEGYAPVNLQAALRAGVPLTDTGNARRAAPERSVAAPPGRATA